jgi:hypothetical protein
MAGLGPSANASSSGERMRIVEVTSIAFAVEVTMWE